MTPEIVPCSMSDPGTKEANKEVLVDKHFHAHKVPVILQKQHPTHSLISYCVKQILLLIGRKLVYHHS